MPAEVSSMIREFLHKHPEFTRVSDGHVKMKELSEQVFKGTPRSTLGDWIHGGDAGIGGNVSQKTFLFVKTCIHNFGRDKQSPSGDPEKAIAKKPEEPEANSLLKDLAVLSKYHVAGLNALLIQFVNASPSDRVYLIEKSVGTKEFYLLLDLLRALSSEEALKKVLAEKPELKM
jgi:hypothetical protein